jgi:hypothetical protein
MLQKAQLGQPAVVRAVAKMWALMLLVVFSPFARCARLGVVYCLHEMVILNHPVGHKKDRRSTSLRFMHACMCMCMREHMRMRMRTSVCMRKPLLLRLQVIFTDLSFHVLVSHCMLYSIGDKLVWSKVRDGLGGRMKVF